MNNQSINQSQDAASWILKNLSTNRQWFDEIRHAGHDNFEREYHYIPLYDLAQLTIKYDIATLKDACYLLKNNNHVDIWGDDFEPYGMLVQITSEGIGACRDFFYGKNEKSISKRAVGVFAMLTVIIALVIGFNKTLLHKQDKNSAHDYNKAKTSEAANKTTAFLDDNDNDK
jgi:hypothetical protein